MTLPPKALANLRALERAATEAQRRYQTYAAGVLAGMGVGPQGARLDLEKGEVTPIPQNGQPETSHA